MWVLGRFSDLAVLQRKACDMVNDGQVKECRRPGGVEASLGASVNYLPVETVSVQNCTVPG
jgi:hypothetical protein